MSSPSLHYWDSNTFINIIQGNEPDGGNDLRQTVDMLHRGLLRVVTSTFTLAEVVRPRRWSNPSLNPSEANRVIQVFNDPNIMLIDLTEHIASRGRQLQWALNIKPADSIHVSTAEFAKVAKLETYDEPLITNVNGADSSIFRHPFEIGHPQPSVPSLNL